MSSPQKELNKDPCKRMPGQPERNMTPAEEPACQEPRDSAGSGKQTAEGETLISLVKRTSLKLCGEKAS